jgi:hypothetical protein
MDSKRRRLRICVVTIGLLAMIGTGRVADAQAPGDDRPTAWTEMMLEFLATGQMPPAPVAETSQAAPTFPGVSPIPNLNITPGGGIQDQTETTVAVGLGAFSNNIVVGYNDRAQLNGGFSGYSFSTDGGQTFTQSTAMPQPTGGTLAGDPVLDTHPAFPGRVYYASLCSANTIPMGTLGICVSISNDGGQNFGNPVIVSTPTCNTTTSVMNDCDTFDKEWLAVDTFTGNVYIAYTNFVGGGPPQPPAVPGSGSLRGQIEAVVCNAALTTCSAPFAVAGNNTVFRQGVSVTFGRTAGQEMVLAWYNRSSGFIESTNCAVGAGPAITACAALTNVVNVGTTAAAPYADPAATLGCGRPALRAASSPFPGFAGGTVAGFRYEPFPVLAADNASFPGAAGFTHLVVAYAAGFAGGGANDIAYFRSADNGGTWPTGPIRVNDNLEAAPQVSDQFFPHISAPKDDPTGRLNVTFYDRRNDQTGLPEPNLLIDVFHSESVARGLVWGVNGKVTDVSFPALPIPGTAANPFCYWGDYIGHASSVLGNHIYTAWGDDRNGQIDVFFAVLHNTQNIAINGDTNFGQVCTAGTRTLPLEIFNTGDLHLSISSVAFLAGSDPALSVSASPSQPFTISPDAHVDLTVQCAPGTIGTKTGTLRIVSSDPDQPQIDRVYTCSVPPGDIRVTGSTSFGNVCSESQAVSGISICNVANTCNLNVTSVAFDPACLDFELKNNPFPAPVSHDSCLDVTTQFTPTSGGAKSCTLKIMSDDPDTPVASVTLTANTPAPSIDVAASQSFAPEVIQSLGACTSSKPFPVSNTGACNLRITDMSIGGTDAGDFSLKSLPSFPIILEPGHIAGEGELKTVFGPTAIDRDRLGTASVTYESDPVTHATTTVTRDLCGEGVNTGARVLVRASGIPLAEVKLIKLQRINGNRNRPILDTVDVAKNLPLVTVNPTSPCTPFQYHREYGTVSNPVQLLPGSYNLTVQAVVNGKNQKKTVGFDVGTCGFNPNIEVNF